MGTREVRSASGDRLDGLAMQRVIRDLDAMERMLDSGAFDTGPRRIGIEQELVLVDRDFRPTPAAERVLARVGDPRVVPEIAKFNVEFNGDPLLLGGRCLSELGAAVHDLFDSVQRACEAEGVSALMTGICPTVERTQLTNDNLIPEDRYFALDEGLKRLRGGDYELRIDGARPFVWTVDADTALGCVERNHVRAASTMSRR